MSQSSEHKGLPNWCQGICIQVAWQKTQNLKELGGIPVWEPSTRALATESVGYNHEKGKYIPTLEAVKQGWKWWCGQVVSAKRSHGGHSKIKSSHEEGTILGPTGRGGYSWAASGCRLLNIMLKRGVPLSFYSCQPGVDDSLGEMGI